MVKGQKLQHWTIKTAANAQFRSSYQHEQNFPYDVTFDS
jgi:hypothetical protein